MNDLLTEELLEELRNSSDPGIFAETHRLSDLSLSQYLQKLLEEHGLVRAEVIRKAGLNETFGYQIFTGQRGASRNKILQLAFAMELNLKECNRLLQAAQVNELYCRRRRDAIIIFCIDHGYSLQNTEEELFRFGEKTIC